MPRERTVINNFAVNPSREHGDAKDAPAQLADYYRWADPDKGVRVYLNFEAAERLQVQVLRGLEVNSGVEVGGILIGRTELDRGRRTAIIDDFESISWTDFHQRLYVPAASGAAKFDAALLRHKSQADPTLSVIGYYRSHNRDNLYLSADDLALIERAFPGSENVFLLIKPSNTKACTGGFFFWDNGRIQSEFTLEVPFAPVRAIIASPTELAGIGDYLSGGVPDYAEGLTPILEDRLPGPGVSVSFLRRSRMRGIFAGILGIALSLGVLGYWQYRRVGVRENSPIARPTPDSRPPAPAPLSARSAAAKTAMPALTHSAATRIDGLPRQAPSLVTASPVSQAPPTPQLPLTETAAASPPTPAPELKLEEAPSLSGQVKMSEMVVAPTAVALPAAIAPPRVEPPTPAPSAPALRTDFAGPQILYRANPQVPQDVRSLIASETQLEVTVKIDAAGKVIDAQVTSTRGAAARLVAAETIKAARMCRFQPARENGQAVQSKMVLTFRFRRTGE